MSIRNLSMQIVPGTGLLYRQLIGLNRDWVPNHSRSYDRTRRAVRFWGHDSAIEAAFWLAERLRGKHAPHLGKWRYARRKSPPHDRKVIACSLGWLFRHTGVSPAATIQEGGSKGRRLSIRRAISPSLQDQLARSACKS